MSPSMSSISRLHPVLQLLRPKQWIKNAFVLAPLFFSLQFTHGDALLTALLATLAFTTLSCTIYIFNDLIDCTQDRLHPVKCQRPIASGALTFRTAYILAAILFITSALLGLYLPTSCYIIMAAYLLINFCYCIKLKHIAIIDVLVIASGFILRLLMGGYAIAVSISPWIIMTTFLLALFLGFGKRHQELSQHSNSQTRPALKSYNLPFLDKLITISCSATLLSYAIYVVEIAGKTGKTSLVYTIFFVVFGLFRYLQTIYLPSPTAKAGAEEPESILFRDPVFAANILIWLITTLWILSH